MFRMFEGSAEVGENDACESGSGEVEVSWMEETVGGADRALALQADGSCGRHMRGGEKMVPGVGIEE